MKIREHYIKFRGNINNISSTKAAIRRMFQKLLRQCNFIRKSKPNNSLVLQPNIANENKMLITQRLCAFFALAQLLKNFVFLFFCSFSFNLAHRIAFVFPFAEEKSRLTFLHVWRIFFSQALSQFCEPQKNLCQLNFVVLYVG